ncbi:uncharacterized protein LOC133342489 [Lethenteron reissneri]|uniref:uncharacterized protein LOC133342489 n=1 Tax=Lethenteron reissneri TaxID=7753 RepID=UPI002AB61D27|nr:uncharacterized protein LOC133342489 [Lethenteron reissneri]
MDKARPPAPWLSTASLRLFTLAVACSVLPSRGFEVLVPGDVFVTAGAVATLSCTYRCEAQQQQQLVTVVEWWRIDRPQRDKILTMDYSIVAHDHRAHWIGNIASCNASISLRDALVSDTGAYLCDVLLLPIYSEGQATLQLHVSPYDVKNISDPIQPLPKPPTTIIVIIVVIVVVIIIVVIAARYLSRAKPEDPDKNPHNHHEKRKHHRLQIYKRHSFASKTSLKSSVLFLTRSPQSTDATDSRNTGNTMPSFDRIAGPFGENELLIEHSRGRRVNRAPCVNSSGGFTVHATSLRTCGCKECKSLLKYTRNRQQEDMTSAVQVGDEHNEAADGASVAVHIPRAKWTTRGRFRSKLH